MSVALSELDKFRFVPLVFALMPREAYVRSRADMQIKPYIVSHLARVGVPASEDLVNILKSTCDQFWETRRGPQNRPMKYKYGMRDVRANRVLYGAINARQNGRCSCCGVDFRTVPQSLDHIIPWRLIGDVPDGSNWQFMCEECNSAKKDYLSSLQSLGAYNWVYSTPLPPLDAPSPETRFAVLSQKGRCGFADCTTVPANGQLFLRKELSTGLAVADHLVVRCKAHL